MKLRLLAIILACFAIGSVACAEDWLRTGDEAYAARDTAKAVAAYRGAKQAQPESYEATWKLARSINDQALLMKRSPEQKQLFLEAQALAKEAVRLNPNDSKGYLYLAICEGKVALFEGGKKKVELGKDVKAQAEKALAMNPRENLAYHVLGIWHREMATLNPVLKFFAQTLYGRFPRASLDESAANFKKAIEINDTSLAHHLELGLTYVAQKQWAEARDEFLRASELPMKYPSDAVYQQQAREELQKVKRRLK
jgi:hypothetical protein